MYKQYPAWARVAHQYRAHAQKEAVAVFADRKCPVELCSEIIPSDHALNNHFLTQHTDLNMDIDSLFDTICSCSEELFTIGLKLSKFV